MLTTTIVSKSCSGMGESTVLSRKPAAFKYGIALTSSRHHLNHHELTAVDIAIQRFVPVKKLWTCSTVAKV